MTRLLLININLREKEVRAKIRVACAVKTCKKIKTYKKIKLPVCLVRNNYKQQLRCSTHPTLLLKCQLEKETCFSD
jgi:hypothetical protein